MFTEMIREIKEGARPEVGLLARRFDAAMTKKLGVVRLPPQFWTQDSKINPRADHLFWAALLIGDRQRVDLAVSVIAAELEARATGSEDMQKELGRAVRRLAGALLELVSDAAWHRELEEVLITMVPAYFPGESEVSQ